jgi:ATP-dependent protease HslVU (ClpYQ) peptidase subunit
MTCIVGLLDKGNVYIGGDSAWVSAPYDTKIIANEKVFKNGDFIFGFTSSFRMVQLLRYSFVPPERDKNMDTYEYMVSVFIEAIRLCFKNGGFTKVSNNEELGGTFLVGYDGRLFGVDSDFQVWEQTCGYDAIGCGWAFALGSLYSTNSLPPEERVLQALKASEEFNSAVRGPFNVVKLK